jgi:hypothetical protein
MAKCDMAIHFGYPPGAMNNIGQRLAPVLLYVTRSVVLVHS